MVEETTDVQTTNQEAEVVEKGSLTFDESVIEKIVAITCQEVDGILEMKGGILSMIQENLGGTDLTKGVDVAIIEDKRADVDLSIIMEYGTSAPKIYQSMRSVIVENVETMTGLKVESLNVHVVGIMTLEEFKRSPN